MCQGAAGIREHWRRGWSTWNRLRKDSWRNVGRRVQLGRAAAIGLLPSQDASHLWEYVPRCSFFYFVRAARKYFPTHFAFRVAFINSLGSPLWSGERPSSEMIFNAFTCCSQMSCHERKMSLNGSSRTNQLAMMRMLLRRYRRRRWELWFKTSTTLLLFSVSC